MPTPKNIEHHLQIQTGKLNIKDYLINIDRKCIKAGADHKHEVRIKDVREIECDKLKDKYPFVQRTCNETQCIEELKLNNTILKTIVFKND